MQKKLTISIDETIYSGLYDKIGKGKISKFIEDLVRPYVTERALEKAYLDLSKDAERENEAPEWSENLITDVTW